MLIDDKAVIGALGLLLEHAGYKTASAYNAQQGLRQAYNEHPDLILLDVNLPDRDGFTVLQRLREQTDSPIVMLTARTAAADKVRGLDEGADDYIIKPFDTQELLARVRKHLHRAHPRPLNKDNYVVDEQLSIDFGAHHLIVDGAAVNLTPLEWRVLRRLVEGAGQIVSPYELLMAGWGRDKQEDTHSIKVHISSLRRKLGDRSRPNRYIHTEREMGYRFEPVKERGK